MILLALLAIAFILALMIVEGLAPFAAGDASNIATTADLTLYTGGGSGRFASHPRLISLVVLNKTGTATDVTIYNGASAGAIIIDAFRVVANGSQTRREGRDFDKVQATSLIVAVLGTAVGGAGVDFIPKVLEE